MANSPNNIEKSYYKYIFKYVCIQSGGKPKLVKIFNMLFTSRILL